MNFEQKVDYMADWWAVSEEQQVNAKIVQEEIESNINWKFDPDILRIKNEINRTYASIIAFNNKYNID